MAGGGRVRSWNKRTKNKSRRTEYQVNRVSRKLFKERNWTFDKVEVFRGRHKKDCYGFGDWLACGGPEEGIILINTTAGDKGCRKHLLKFTSDPDVANNAIDWLVSGGRIVVINWWQPKGEGKWEIESEIEMSLKEHFPHLFKKD